MLRIQIAFTALWIVAAVVAAVSAQVSRTWPSMTCGKTYNIRHRMAGLQNGSGEPIEILRLFEGYSELERVLHRKFAKYRSHGEWFNYSKKIRAFVNNKYALETLENDQRKERERTEKVRKVRLLPAPVVVGGE